MHPTTRQAAIPCTLMRGGTSKAAFFRAVDLPPAGADRDAFLLAAMGYPDSRQIDGIGGGNPLTTKVAIIAPSQRVDCDVDYLFAQVVPAESRVDYTPTCGNILAAVGPFAVEQGWVDAIGSEATVRIYLCNTQARCTANVPVADGAVSYAGDACIGGVPGTAAPIYLRFHDILGSNCGGLFPTGHQRDVCAGIAVTCVDHGMPVVVLAACDLGVHGDESPAELDADADLKQHVEAIRLEAGHLMGLGDVGDKVVPKVTLLSPPQDGGHVSTRSFIPHRCHDAIGVLGAVSVASATLFPGSVAYAWRPDGNDAQLDVVIEHPTGRFDVRLFRSSTDAGLEGAAVMRTARALFRGDVLVPAEVMPVASPPSSTGAVLHGR